MDSDRSGKETGGEYIEQKGGVGETELAYGRFGNQIFDGGGGGEEGGGGGGGCVVWVGGGVERSGRGSGRGSAREGCEVASGGHRRKVSEREG